MTRPKLVLLDEVSMGSAPIIVNSIFVSISDLKALGTSVLLVEHFVQRVLAVADHVYVLSCGRVATSAAPADLDREMLIQSYLHQDLTEANETAPTG